LLEVLGGIAAETVRVGKRQVVLDQRPASRIYLARPEPKSPLVGRDALLQIVGGIALPAPLVVRGNMEPELALDRLTRGREWPRRETWLQSQSFLGQHNALLWILELLHLLHQAVELCCDLLLAGVGGGAQPVEGIPARLVIRIDLQHAAQIRQGVFSLTERLVNVSSVVERPDVFWIELDRLAEISNRAISTSFCGVGPAPAMVR